jgi:hypothetical protein
MNYDSKGFLEYILSNPYRHEWSVQGLGMLRLYLNKRDRLSIWHNEGRILDASPIHDHYWSFRSWILAGTLRNRRYFECAAPYGSKYNRYRIQTGEKPDKQILEGPLPSRMMAHSTEIYHSGDSYYQAASERHETEFENGTISLIRRLSYLSKRDEANVWSYEDRPFVSAEPRAATKSEIDMYVEAAKKHLTS